MWSVSRARSRGAAFGLSGLVKGLGISSLRNLNIMDSLKAAVEVTEWEAKSLRGILKPGMRATERNCQ